MTALVVNILTAILGALAASGVKLSLSPETVAQLAGALVTVVAIVNQVIHSARDKDSAGGSQKGFASVPLLIVMMLAALALTACGALGGIPSISPEQLATTTKANGAAAGCVAGAGLYGHGNAVVVNAEHATLASGRITVASDCSVTIEANQTAPAK